MTLFKSIEESIELYKHGVKPDTEYEYVYNCEESELDDFNIKGDTKAQLELLKKEADVGYTRITIDDERDKFAEFTQVICPAYKA